MEKMETCAVLYCLSTVCKGLMVWNDLDKDLQMSPAVHVYKKILRKQLL